MSFIWSFEKKKNYKKKNFWHDAIVERGELKATVFAIVEVPDCPSFPGNADRSWFLRVLFSYFLFYFEGLSSCVMFCFSLVFHLSALFPQRHPCGSCVPRVPCASLFVLYLLFVFYFLFLLLGLCILVFWISLFNVDISFLFSPACLCMSFVWIPFNLDSTNRAIPT